MLVFQNATIVEAHYIMQAQGLYHATLELAKQDCGGLAREMAGLGDRGLTSCANYARILPPETLLDSGSPKAKARA
jgi:hypothetical protein